MIMEANNNDNHETVVDQLRNIMNKIENDIMNYKEGEKEKYVSLNSVHLFIYCVIRQAILGADERILDRDLSQFHIRMENWDKEEEGDYHPVLDNQRRMKNIQRMNKKKLDEENVPVQLLDYDVCFIPCILVMKINYYDGRILLKRME
jgi:hypothetical protein